MSKTEMNGEYWVEEKLPKLIASRIGEQIWHLVISVRKKKKRREKIKFVFIT